MRLRRVVVAVLLGAAATGCAAGHRSSASSAPSDPPCAVSNADARSLLGAVVTLTKPRPIPGMASPVQRCLYSASGDRSLQFTAFNGTALYGQMRILLSDAPDVPGLGAGGYCGGGKGSGVASFSCIFLEGGSTYVLALQVPAAQDRDDLHKAVQDYAFALATRIKQNQPT